MKTRPEILKSVDLAVKNHPKILLAVSGGGDSVAMLHLFASKAETSHLHVATVDHGLRPESASEAEFVAELCSQLELPHTTLTWNPPDKTSSQDARLARYDLLTRYGLQIGATAIALAHTMDDQAETLVMRARRMTGESGTRGLAGIPEESTHARSPDHAIKFIRPLLTVSRARLRQYLTDCGQEWIDDPSNENPDYERIRVRHSLANCNSSPTVRSIARLASLSSRSRHWLNLKTSELLYEDMTVQRDGSLQLHKHDAPAALIGNAFATLILTAGGLQHRVPPAKIRPLVEAFQYGSNMRRNLGRALVTISQTGARFEREARNQVPTAHPDGPVDGRFFRDNDGDLKPFIKALEQFRPGSDDPLSEVINEKLRRSGK